jgi:hypothetical protein
MPRQGRVRIERSGRVGRGDELGMFAHDRPVPGRGAQQQEATDRPFAFIGHAERVRLHPRPAHLLLEPAQLRMRLDRDERLIGRIEHEVDDTPDRAVDGDLRPCLPALVPCP